MGIVGPGVNLLFIKCIHPQFGDGQVKQYDTFMLILY